MFDFCCDQPDGDNVWSKQVTTCSYIYFLLNFYTFDLTRFTGLVFWLRVLKFPGTNFIS